MATVLIGMNYTGGLVEAFQALILLSTLTTLLPYAAASLSALVLMRKDRDQGLPRASLRHWLIALGALAFSLFAIVGSGMILAAQGLVLLAAGIPVYYLMKRNSSASNAKTD